jgi:hypothetical protein
MKTSDNNGTAAKPRKARESHGVEGGTREANRLAVVILEVLAGGRTPTDAAAALAITVPRYYQLEMRALEGLVAALEPRPKGKQPSLEGRLAQLEKELEEARHECARQQALVRAAQRSMGIKPPVASNAKKPAKNRAGRRQRRPTVRALKAVAALKKKVRSESTEAVQQQAQRASAVSSTEDSPAKDNVPRHGASGIPEGAIR